MKVLVTGGTGFIGRNLVPQLLENDHDIALLVREPYGMGGSLPAELQAHRQQLQLVYADLRNYRQTSRAVIEANPDKVIHLAAAGTTNPFLGVDTALRHNVSGTLNLLRACFENGSQIGKFIVGRTSGEKTMMNVYATSKAAAWNFCQMYAQTHRWPIVGMMIFQAYGWGQSEPTLIPSAFRAAMAGQNFPMTTGEQERDWIYVADVVQAIIATLNADLAAGTTVELGTGATTSVADVARLIYQVSESQGKPLIGARPSRPGETLRQCAAALTTKQLINWQAAHSLEDGLTRYHAKLSEPQ